MREYDDCSMRRHNYTRLLIFFFFNDTATTEIYTLSLHDALPICIFCGTGQVAPCKPTVGLGHLYTKTDTCALAGDRKSTRLNSSHVRISYAVFCLKKKKNNRRTNTC